MPILNYTTEVEAAKTISEIEQILVKHGARNISKNYGENGQIESLYFVVKVANQDVPIQLPIDPESVLKVLTRQGVENRYLSKPQSVRVAWRIIKVWVEAQMALLETQQVKMEQIFLPYVVTPSGKTVYEAIAESKFLQITDGSVKVDG